MGRYSKSRYLKQYYMLSIFTQINLYTALFTLQAVLDNSDSTIVLIVIATILLASQLGEGKEHLVFHKEEMGSDKPTVDTLAGLSTAVSAPKVVELVTDPEEILKQRKRISWHGKMIFFPGIVAIFSTLIFLLGLFTVLFAYGITKADDGREICASGPMAVWASMSLSGWFFALWHIVSYVPVLLTLTMLSFTHFRSYNDVRTPSVLVILGMTWGLRQHLVHTTADDDHAGRTGQLKSSTSEKKQGHRIYRPRGRR